MKNVKTGASVPDGTEGFRYCFVLPDLSRPMGGQTVLYEMAETLRTAGHEVVLVHGGRFHRYEFAQTECEIFHFPALATLGRAQGVRARVAQVRRSLAERRSNPALPLFRPGPRDVMVIPEFSYETYGALFPDVPLVMMALDPTALLRAFSRDEMEMHKRYTAVLATSEAITKAVQILLDRQPYCATLSVARPGLQADHPKKLQIAYMPRKLGTQAARVVQAFKRRAALADVPVVAIRNMTNAERDQVLNESLIFLAFSNMEGFGLPPAEAMAAGCLVIGYTGIGANEFFTDETGFVIEQNDTPGMVARTEEVVEAYRRDPAALDAKRAQAAGYIADRYTSEKARASLLAAWEAVVADLHTKAPAGGN